MRRLALACLVALAAAPAFADHSMPPAADAPADAPPLYGDLGSWHRAITTASPEAQRYFDQGLVLCYGFNHAEAIRAFREAARLDPRCAMAWWGVAYANGPNINLPMDDAMGAEALDAIGKAQALAADAGALEREWIAALATRYAAKGSTRAELDSAYANAMRALAKKHPKDADAWALFGESLLDLNPWNQWRDDGKPNPGTLEALAALETAMKLAPDHPGANHFYIHAVEASPHPERANAAAKRLEALVPGAGHLVHMPSHIYARTGRYDDAVRRNQIAMAVDEKYIAEQKPQGLYPLMYYNHNIQFVWFCAMMEGRSAESLAAARKMAGNVPDSVLAQMPMIQFVSTYEFLTLLRFGKWKALLATKAPPEEQVYSRAMWHYAQGLAAAVGQDEAGAASHLAALRRAATGIPADMMISINYAAPLLRVAVHALEGEIAGRRTRRQEAIAAFKAAVAAEDSLHYDEPPTWYSPVRQRLGAELLVAGRSHEAETVYREDLLRHPENGWSLFGLQRALEMQGRTKEAAAVAERFKRAWARADVKLEASMF